MKNNSTIPRLAMSVAAGALTLGVLGGCSEGPQAPPVPSGVPTALPQGVPSNLPNVPGIPGQGQPGAAAPAPGAPPGSQDANGQGGQGGQGAGGQAAADRATLQRQLDQLLAAAPITFEADNATLTPAGRSTVDMVGELLAPAAGVGVKITGHTAPAPGDPATAQSLSQQRAQAVAEALAAKGVSTDRIQAVGAGQAPDGTTTTARRVGITLT